MDMIRTMIDVNVLQVRRFSLYGLLLAGLVCLNGCREAAEKEISSAHADRPFIQDRAVKYNLQDSVKLQRVASDRNGVIQIATSGNLFKPHAGEHLFPGALVRERYYRPIADKKIAGVISYRDHLVYVDDKAVLSNAWAGILYVKHTLPGASQLAGGKDFDFLISDGESLQYLKDSTVAWESKKSGAIRDIVFDSSRNRFWLLTSSEILSFNPVDNVLKSEFKRDGLTCLTVSLKDNGLVVGTREGYFVLGNNMKAGEMQRKLPWTDITAVSEIDGKLWFGSTRGAFMERGDGKFNYYASRRWLPSDRVVDVKKGPENSVLILTDKGLGQIFFDSMTLADKAEFFQKQVRNRHIRHGFNATLGYMQDGNVSAGSLEDSDNDGLWTTMYMGAEVFRYAVTKSEDALQNLRESMDAIERLYTINGVKGGFPSRSFERRGYKYDDKPWRRANHPEWDWKSTTSSDEAIGHMFIFGAMAELLDDEDLKKRAIVMMDSLMQHVVDNDMYLVDWDGKPTLWGKWHPDYVNARPAMVGDRKINASNIVAMLQTAYHFTKKEIYKNKAFELMTEHGYYENLMRPMSQVGRAPDYADNWSKMLSESWNHSDDEMYFLGYWGLYRYAFNDTLKTNFRKAIIDHWEIERPEKEGAWNIFTAITGVEDFDLEEAVWYLQEYPMDLIHWRVTNSHRMDVEKIEPNFRDQTTKEVLPPDELPVNRHNANRFELDGGDGGTSEYSAGDIWLLPYWMGRYLGAITDERPAPSEKGSAAAPAK